MSRRHFVISRLVLSASALAFVATAACGPDEAPATRIDPRTTLDELLLENARTCDSGYTYPQELIDGLSLQLIDELRCMDDSWLEFYEPCKEPGCIWASGPQPLALRPEVIDALREIGLAAADYISITAGYRDVAMQYFSRWRTENCDPNFNAAIPGTSNHQGGRAIDVLYYDYWHETLLNNGFEHPIPDDEPHFELYGDETFRQESDDLKVLSVMAFQRLWNRNFPDDPLAEDGIYGAQTKARLGGSPVEGFPIGGCGVPWETPDAGDGEDVPDVPDAGDVINETDAADTSSAPDGDDTVPDAAGDVAPDDTGASSPDAGPQIDVRPGPLPPSRYSLVSDDAPVETRGCASAPSGANGFGGAAVVFLALFARRRSPGRNPRA